MQFSPSDKELIRETFIIDAGVIYYGWVEVFEKQVKDTPGVMLHFLEYLKFVIDDRRDVIRDYMFYFMDRNADGHFTEFGGDLIFNHFIHDSGWYFTKWIKIRRATNADDSYIDVSNQELIDAILDEVKSVLDTEFNALHVELISRVSKG